MNLYSKSVSKVISRVAIQSDDWTVSKGRIRDGYQIRPASPDPIHIINNSKPNFSQKLCAYYMRHVITFKCCNGPKYTPEISDA